MLKGGVGFLSPEKYFSFCFPGIKVCLHIYSFVQSPWKGWASASDWSGLESKMKKGRKGDDQYQKACTRTNSNAVLQRMPTCELMAVAITVFGQSFCKRPLSFSPASSLSNSKLSNPDEGRKIRMHHKNLRNRFSQSLVFCSGMEGFSDDAKGAAIRAPNLNEIIYD